MFKCSTAIKAVYFVKVSLNYFGRVFKVKTDVGEKPSFKKSFWQLKG